MIDYRKTIQSLSPAQRKAFEDICERGYPDNPRLATLNALAAKGLIRSMSRAPKPGLLPVIVGWRAETLALAAWHAVQQEQRERQLSDRDHCAECGATMLYLENRRICPNGHGKSVLDKRAPKDKCRDLEIVVKDLRKAVFE